jgi:hypothetical protein
MALLEGICFKNNNLPLVNRGVGVFFSRQDDRPGASNGQRAIAAEKGKTWRRFLLE